MSHAKLLYWWGKQTGMKPHYRLCHESLSSLLCISKVIVNDHIHHTFITFSTGDERMPHRAGVYNNPGGWARICTIPGSIFRHARIHIYTSPTCVRPSRPPARRWIAERLDPQWFPRLRKFTRSRRSFTILNRLSTDKTQLGRSGTWENYLCMLQAERPKNCCGWMAKVGRKIAKRVKRPPAPSHPVFCFASSSYFHVKCGIYYIEI